LGRGGGGEVCFSNLIYKKGKKKKKNIQND